MSLRLFGQVRIGEKIILKGSLNRAIVTPIGLITQSWGSDSYRIDQSMVEIKNVAKKEKKCGGGGFVTQIMENVMIATWECCSGILEWSRLVRN